MASDRAKRVTRIWEAMKVVRCERCGLYHVDPMPSWSIGELQTLYDGDYFPEESDWWRHTRKETDPRRRLGLIKCELEATSQRPQLLDVGCGQGYVLEYALQIGWEAWGLEPSKFWAARTESRLGVKVWSQPVEKAEVPEASCDIVFSDSVIEHLNDPIALLRLARRALKPGGVAYIVTPNADALVNDVRRLIFRLRGSDRAAHIEPLSSPYHVVGFNPASLRILARRAGFRVKYMQVHCGPEEWRKDRDWTSGKLKALALWPVLFLGKMVKRGTTIEALLVALPEAPDRG